MSRQQALSLSQFAFQSELPKTASRFISTAVAQKRARPPGGAAGRRTTARDRKKALLADISVSESAVSRLQKCVCCDARWTTRKTVAQKLIHIQSCSKKRCYTSEAVSILIGKELNTVAETKIEETPATSNTHMEDVVKDSLPRKKGKKKGSTVQVYNSETRETILKRARAILGPAVNIDEDQEGLDFPVSTQALRSSSNPARTLETGISSTAPSSPTWSFLPSKLNFQQNRYSGASHSHLFPPDEELSPYSGQSNTSESVKVSSPLSPTFRELIA